MPPDKYLYAQSYRKRTLTPRDPYTDDAFMPSPCIICHNPPAERTSLFCEFHMQEYREWKHSGIPGFSDSADAFALVHRDNHPDHPAISIATAVHVLRECPKCNTLAELDYDYICKDCRYG